MRGDERRQEGIEEERRKELMEGDEKKKDGRNSDRKIGKERKK